MKRKYRGTKTVHTKMPQHSSIHNPNIKGITSKHKTQPKDNRPLRKKVEDVLNEDNNKGRG